MRFNIFKYILASSNCAFSVTTKPPPHTIKNTRINIVAWLLFRIDKVLLINK